MSIIECSQCKSEGRTNKCYITGYNIKCSHDNGWAYSHHKIEGEIIKCNCCPGGNNGLYITGYDYKCGHDNGWAYFQNTCAGCSTTLSGRWAMETNPYNVNLENGKHLGLSAYFFHNSIGYVNSYCQKCWIIVIKNSLPSLGITLDNSSELNSLNQKVSVLQANFDQCLKLNNTENIIGELNKKLQEYEKTIQELSSKVAEPDKSVQELKHKLVDMEVKLQKFGEENENLSWYQSGNLKFLYSNSFIEKYRLITSLLEKTQLSIENFSPPLKEFQQKFENLALEKFENEFKGLSTSVLERIKKIEVEIAKIKNTQEIMRELNAPEEVINNSLNPMLNYQSTLLDQKKILLEIIEVLK